MMTNNNSNNTNGNEKKGIKKKSTLSFWYAPSSVKHFFSTHHSRCQCLLSVPRTFIPTIFTILRLFHWHWGAFPLWRHSLYHWHVPPPFDTSFFFLFFFFVLYVIIFRSGCVFSEHWDIYAARRSYKKNWRKIVYVCRLILLHGAMTVFIKLHFFFFLFLFLWFVFFFSSLVRAWISKNIISILFEMKISFWMLKTARSFSFPHSFMRFETSRQTYLPVMARFVACWRIWARQILCMRIQYYIYFAI